MNIIRFQFETTCLDHFLTFLWFNSEFCRIYLYFINTNKQTHLLTHLQMKKKGFFSFPLLKREQFCFDDKEERKWNLWKKKHDQNQCELISPFFSRKHFLSSNEKKDLFLIIIILSLLLLLSVLLLLLLLLLCVFL